MAASSSSSSKKVILKTFDGAIFEVDEAVAVQSSTIQNMIDEGYEDTEFPLHNVKRKILEIVIEYCKEHVDESIKSEIDLKEWDLNFINRFNTDLLYHLLLAANYLEVKGLMDLVITKVSDLIKGKTPKEIRKTFNIKNDFTPEQEAEIRNENPWALELEEEEEVMIVEVQRKVEILEIEEKGKEEDKVGISVNPEDEEMKPGSSSSE